MKKEIRLFVVFFSWNIIMGMTNECLVSQVTPEPKWSSVSQSPTEPASKSTVQQDVPIDWLVLRREYFLRILNNYSPDLYENFQKIERQDKIKALYQVNDLLKAELKTWNTLDTQLKRKLEFTYISLWRYLGELCKEEPNIFEKFKTEIHEEGNHLALLVFVSDFIKNESEIIFQSVQKEIIALFERSKNAAVINNCSGFILHLSEKKQDVNGWELLQKKLDSLKSEPLTEQTAMGIILLQSAFQYVEEKKREEELITQGHGAWIQQPASNYFPDRIKLSDMEEKMTWGLKEFPQMVFPYGTEIQKMLKEDQLKRQQ